MAIFFGDCGCGCGDPPPPPPPPPPPGDGGDPALPLHGQYYWASKYARLTKNGVPPVTVAYYRSGLPPTTIRDSGKRYLEDRRGLINISTFQRRGQNGQFWRIYSRYTNDVVSEVESGWSTMAWNFSDEWTADAMLIETDEANVSYTETSPYNGLPHTWSRALSVEHTDETFAAEHQALLDAIQYRQNGGGSATYDAHGSIILSLGGAYTGSPFYFQGKAKGSIAPGGKIGGGERIFIEKMEVQRGDYRTLAQNPGGVSKLITWKFTVPDGTWKYGPYFPSCAVYDSATETDIWQTFTTVKMAAPGYAVLTFSPYDSSTLTMMLPNAYPPRTPTPLPARFYLLGQVRNIASPVTGGVLLTWYHWEPWLKFRVFRNTENSFNLIFLNGVWQRNNQVLSYATEIEGAHSEDNPPSTAYPGVTFDPANPGLFAFNFTDTTGDAGVTYHYWVVGYFHTGIESAEAYVGSAVKPAGSD